MRVTMLGLARENGTLVRKGRQGGLKTQGLALERQSDWVGYLGANSDIKKKVCWGDLC